jgi:hypothetical protein
VTGDRWQLCEQGVVSVIPKKMQHQEEVVLQVLLLSVTKSVHLFVMVTFMTITLRQNAIYKA